MSEERMNQDPQEPIEEDEPFVSRVGPVDIDWPRSFGYFGGIAVAVALELIAPELALFVACVPLVKLLKRRHASKVEKTISSVIEGAAKPLGGDAQATVRLAWLDDWQRAAKARPAGS
jgi:hypothetical protein